MGHSDDMRDYIADRRISNRDFQAMYKMDHGFDLSRLQKRAIGIPTEFRVRSRPAAYRVYATEPDADRVRVVRGKKVEKVTVTFTKDRRGQLHKVGPDNRFQRMTRADRKGLGIVDKGVKKRRPSQPKKLSEVG